MMQPDGLMIIEEKNYEDRGDTGGGGASFGLLNQAAADDDTYDEEDKDRSTIILRTSTISVLPPPTQITKAVTRKLSREILWLPLKSRNHHCHRHLPQRSLTCFKMKINLRQGW